MNLSILSTIPKYKQKLFSSTIIIYQGNDISQRHPNLNTAPANLIENAP